VFLSSQLKQEAKIGGLKFRIAKAKIKVWLKPHLPCKLIALNLNLSNIERERERIAF
jgi:hypothetical protein